MNAVLMMWVIFHGVSGVAIAAVGKQSFEPSPSDNLVDYHYNYAVEDDTSGVYMSSWEERRSDYTRGSYSLLEPGGHVRTVDYQVDASNGFKAVMSIFPPGFNWLSTRRYLESLELHPHRPGLQDLHTQEELSKGSSRNDYS